MTPANAAERQNSVASRFWHAIKLVQIRLRIPVALLAALLLVGKWESIRNVWVGWGRSFTLERAGMGPVSGDTEYFCPMDPGVVSDWPGKCGVCNMALVRRKRGEASALPDGVVARMQLSPARIELANIETVPIESRSLARVIELDGSLMREGKSLVVQAVAQMRHAAWIVPGREAQVSWPDEPGKPAVEARISAVERVADGPIQRLRIAAKLKVGEPAAEVGARVRLLINAPVSELEPFRSRAGSAPLSQVLAVPRSAVVELESDGSAVVFVESAPGMFEGVAVMLGPRCGDFYPVVSGLEPGLRVAASGAFLLDAETRLNPALASAYFGARATGGAVAQANPSARPPERRSTSPSDRIEQALAQLVPADRTAARRQARCPVTGKPLGSMGTPVRTVAEGRVVFLCCDGCAESFKDDPGTYLSRLNSPQAP